jgi:hypothetical protein
MVRDAAESIPNAITLLILVLISGVTVFIWPSPEFPGEVLISIAALLIIQGGLRRKSTAADSACGEFARLKSATGRTRCGELGAHLTDLRRLL